MLLTLLLTGKVLQWGGAVSHSLKVSSFTSDSRKVEQGGVYFAIRGTAVDGHTLIKDAFFRGASAAVIEDPSFLSENTILVSNSRKAFAEASSVWFGIPSQGFQLVGITGTNGKTTCSYLLDQMWGSLGKKTGLIGTVETKIGDEIIPSTLTTPGPYDLQGYFAKMQSNKISHAVMEVSSIALDQYRTAGTKFACALFTNLTQDHLDYHGTMEKYFEAKARLFSEYDIPNAVLNADDPSSEKLARMFKGRLLSYGKKPSSDYHLLQIETGSHGSQAKVRTPRGEYFLETPLFGLHNLYNCLGVLAVGDALGLSLDECLLGLKTAMGAPGRLERVMQGNAYPSIFVDFAHSDDALRNVLKVLNDFRKKGQARVITVFGCGGDRDRLKRPKMAQVASAYSDVTIATSDNPRTENPQKILDEIETGIDSSATVYIREADRRAAIHKALELAGKEDLVLIAGKGHETYQIIGTEKTPFDDREVVRQYYSLK